MSGAVVGFHEHEAQAEHSPPAPPPRGIHRFLAPGWLRTLWTIPLFFGIGAGLVVLIRWLETWHPIWPGSIITTVELTTVPLGFLVGIGGFDYWFRYASGAPTAPEDHSGHGAQSWKDYFRINTDHKVIGIQYLVTTIVFFVIAGLLAMFMRAELARPGMQFVDNQTFNGLALTGGNNQIRGLVFNHFAAGIAIFSDENAVYGNYIGTDVTGTAVPM